jgi:hypothetical protein
LFKNDHHGDTCKTIIIGGNENASENAKKLLDVALLALQVIALRAKPHFVCCNRFC